MTCTSSSTAALTIWGRGQADAFVDHFHAAVAGAHGDLFRAVGMAIEAGLADQEFQPAAEFGRERINTLAHGGQIAGIVAGRLANAGGRAVFAEDVAQGPAPLAGGHAGLGGGNRRFHDVAAFAGGGFQLS